MLRLAVGGSTVYRTDDYDAKSPFYYLADGESEWVEMSHGNDGCFGKDQSSEMKGKVGYLALPIEYFRNGGAKLKQGELVTGIYLYCDVTSGTGEKFYIDEIWLVEDYTQFQ